MQELTFDQVEDVSGGFTVIGSGIGISPWIIESQVLNSQDGGGRPQGTGGVTAVSTTIAASNFGGAAVVGKVLGTGPGLAAAAVGVAAGTAFNLTQEGRDGMRVQNHPATRHLYNADGSRK